MRSLRLFLIFIAAVELKVFVASQSGYYTSANYSACINQTVARIVCPGNQSMMYKAGDMATGVIPNCALPFWEPGTATSHPTVKLLHPNIVITNTTVIPLARTVSESMQYPVDVDVVDSVTWTKEPLREFENSSVGKREAWFLDPVLTADMADKPVAALQDMSQLVLQDRNLNWNGYGTFFRQFASVYNGKVVGLPVSAAIMLLYYRRDFFKAQNISVPATWEEVVDIAEKYNGTDLDGTGTGAWGFCMSRQPKCYNGYTFQTIQVPFLQAQGTSQGFHFNPDTMEPLINSSGTRRAAELYRRLSPFIAPTEPVACLPVSLAFVRGKCLMAVGTTLHFKYAMFNNSLNNITRVNGKTGTAVLPGSFEVMDRKTGQLVRCNPEVCPHGYWHTLANGTKAWVNSAPYAGRGAFTYAINRHREPHLQYIAYRLCARRVYADAMWPAVLNPIAETTPVRTEMVDPANVARYINAGYDGNDTLLFMKAVSDTMEHANIALNLRIYGALEYYMAVDTAAVALSDTNTSIGNILAAAQQDVVNQYSNVSAEWLRQRYWKTIDRQQPEPPPPDSAARPEITGTSGLDVKTKVGIGVGAGVGGGLLLFGLLTLAVVVLLRPAFLSARHGKWYVPYASPECTLVVTDMEGSTTLWEAFPGDVMQAALQKHDAIARRTLSRHRGYESATEGDSFIVAFPNVLKALRFAQDFQAELMAADWPAVLLQDSDLCRPVYATPRAAKDGEQGQLFRRSASLRHPLIVPIRAVDPPPSSLPSAASFAHVTAIANTLSTAAAAGPTSSATIASAVRKVGGAQLMPLRTLQAPGGGMTLTAQQKDHLLQLQEVKWSQQGSGGLGTSLGDVPEKYVADTTSIGSLGSLSGAGRLPSGFFRKQSMQSGAAAASGIASGGALGGVHQGLPRLLSQQSLRASPLSAPPRAHPAADDHGDDGRDFGAASPPSAAPLPLPLRGDSASAERPSVAVSEDSAADCLQARAGLRPPSNTAISQLPQQLLTKPSADEPSVSANLAMLMASDFDVANSAAATAATWSAVATNTAAAALPPLAEGFAAAVAGGAMAFGGVSVAAAAAAAPAAAGVKPGSVAGGGIGGTWSWGSEAASAWQILEGPSPETITVFRGLRIRIGLHAGVRPSELTRTRASSRISFCGMAIRMAKAVSDAANGGMIVLSDTAAGLLLGTPEVAALLAGEGTVVWHLGRVKLASDLRDVEMFQVLTPSLAPRLALQQPIRVRAQLLPGVLAAPAGNVALVRLHVSGMVLLRATDVMLAEELAGVLEALLVESLPLLGGYLSEARQGGAEGITVAFPDCLRAVAWALAVQADMLHWNWSRELLNHEAFETISVDSGFGPSFTEQLYGDSEPYNASAAAEAPLRNPPSKTSRSRVCDSPVATVSSILPNKSSFLSHVSKGVQSATAGTPAVAASGGGLSFSSQTGRALESGGSRIGMFASSFTSSFIIRSQQYLLRGSASRKLVSNVEGPVPSLLSPLQPPPEAPVEAPKRPDFDRKTSAKRITLQGFRRWGSRQLGPGEDFESPGNKMERGEAREEQANVAQVLSGRMEGTKEQAAVEASRPSPAEESFRLEAIMLQPAAAAAAATGAAKAPADATATATARQVPIAEGLEDATAEASSVNMLHFSHAAAVTAAPSSPCAVAAAECRGPDPWLATQEGSIAHGKATTTAVAAAAAAPSSAAAAAATEPETSRISSTSRTGPRGPVGHKILFRGPRTKAVIDFGGVTPEVCRTTGRLLYKGRMAKYMTKLMEAAQRGQVLCTAAVYAQAASAAPHCGIVMTPVGTPGGPGRRKGLASNSRSGYGSSKAPSAAAAAAPAAAAPAALTGASGSTAPQPTGAPTEMQEGTVAAAAATSRKVQCFLCTLTAPPRGVGGYMPPPLSLSPPPQHHDGKPLLLSENTSFHTVLRAGDSPHTRSKPEL
ncbi:hypothetical protein VaNZ11_007352 [Volvox africanus]|uniref:Guanylate cyclase domain-containing protein n=1 Tax=Volvox africanus TaxID=51714 RepID=A0ABQ5S3A4_9CHLO|nr:hypothetical protein VaNZ11_007352 [Volvox africanus]